MNLEDPEDVFALTNATIDSFTKLDDPEDLLAKDMIHDSKPYGNEYGLGTQYLDQHCRQEHGRGSLHLFRRSTSSAGTYIVRLTKYLCKCFLY